MKKSILSLIAISLSIVAWAQPQLSLSDAIALALKQNYDIVIGQKSLQVAQNNNNWEAAGAFPTLSFNATQLNNFSWSDPADMTYHSLKPAISMQWTIFGGLRIRTTKRMLEQLQSLSEAQLAQQIESTIKSVILAYYGSVLERENLNILQQQMTLSRDRYHAVQVRKNLGAAVTFDLLQAQNDYLADSAGYLQQAQNFRNAQRNLRFLMADSTQNSYQLTDSFANPSEQYQLADLMQRLQQNNKTLRLQQTALHLSEIDEQQAHNAWYPSLSLSSGLDKTWQSTAYTPGTTTDLNSFNAFAQFTLSWSIYNGGQRRRNIQNTRIETEKTQLELRQLEHMLNNQIANELENYEVRQQLLKVATEAEQSARLNLQIAREKYERGAINSFNYRDVQNRYLYAAQSQLLARFNIISSRTEIMRLIGELLGAE